MRKRWREIAARYDRLSTREQALVAGACLVLLWLSIDSLLLAPAAVKQKRAAQEIAQRRQETRTLAGQLAALESKRGQGPEAAARRRLQELQTQLAALQGDIRTQSALLIAADRMPKVLERLLANHPRVELVELKALPRIALDFGANPKKPGPPEASRSGGGAGEKAGADDTPKGIYRYGLELAIRGSYLDLLAYLRSIEAYPERFFWERAELAVVEYPVSTLRLKLYTLSLDNQWMRV